jgi:hypothetical protein
VSHLPAQLPVRHPPPCAGQIVGEHGHSAADDHQPAVTAAAAAAAAAGGSRWSQAGSASARIRTC